MKPLYGGPRRVGRHEGVYAPRGPVSGADDDGLADRTPAGVQLLVGMLVPFLPAHGGLIDLDRPHEWLGGAIREGLPDPMQHEPSGPLAYADRAPEGGARDPLRARHLQVDRDDPLAQRERGACETVPVRTLKHRRQSEHQYGIGRP